MVVSLPLHGLLLQVVGVAGELLGDGAGALRVALGVEFRRAENADVIDSAVGHETASPRRRAGL